MIKYKVTLTKQEREELLSITKGGCPQFKESYTCIDSFEL